MAFLAAIAERVVSTNGFDAQKGDTLGALHWRDDDSDTARIRAVADDDWTKTRQSIRYEFFIRPPDEASLRLVATAKPVGWTYVIDGSRGFSFTEPTHFTHECQQMFVLDLPEGLPQ